MTGRAEKVVIIDYGSGNLHSAVKAFERAASQSGFNGQIVVSDRLADVADADRVVLPGVGAFADCRAGLDKVGGLVETLERRVHREGRPFLGICVGMQLMADRGLEYMVSPGLGWIGGEVRVLEPSDPALKIPHMGWNTLDVCAVHTASPHPLLAGIRTGDDGLHAYFVHSYHLVAKDPADIAATTRYGGPVTAMVARNNVAGTQFHPEKSQRLGLQLIANFLAWKP